MICSRPVNLHRSIWVRPTIKIR